MQLIDRLSHKTIEISFYALFFFTPLIFTSINSELFELPKMYFVWVVTILIVGAWIIRMIASERIIFRRTFLDIPLLIFLISQFLSFFFSSDPHTSFWGYYSRLNGGIASTITYALLYWAFVSNMVTSNTLQAMRFLLFSGLVVALWGIPAHFGYDPTCFVFGYGLNTDCWSSNFVPTQRIFSTLGQPNWLASWLVAMMPIGWAMLILSTRDMLHVTRQKIIRVTSYVLLVTIFFLALIYTKSDSGFLGIGATAIVFVGGLIIHNMRRSSHIVSTTLVIAIILLPLTQLTKFSQPIQNCFSILSSPTHLTLPDPLPTSGLSTRTITPSTDIRCIVWRGAIKIWQGHPWFGTGPETFAYSYYSVKPPEHNLTSEWNFLYNKAHNEYLNYLANTGALGLVAYLILILSIITVFLKFKMQNAKFKITIQNSKFFTKSAFGLLTLDFALLAGYAGILVTNFFGFSVVPTQLLFFLYPAFALTLTHNTHPTSKPTTYDPLPIPKLILLTPIILTTLYLLLSTFKYFLADIHYDKSQKHTNNGEYQQALSSIRSALEFRPSEPLYWSELSDILSSLALISINPDLASETSELAKNSSNTAISISPANITFWKTRANTFLKLASINPKYMNQAQKSYEKAASLAPTDAEVQYNLAFFYWQADDLEKSREQAEKALLLRPHYEDAKKLLRELSNSP